MDMVCFTCADPEGGVGLWSVSPLKITKNIGFYSNTGPGSLINHKATKPVFNVGPSSVHLRVDDGGQLAFRWLIDDGRLLVVFVVFWTLPPFIN